MTNPDYETGCRYRIYPAWFKTLIRDHDNEAEVRNGMRELAEHAGQEINRRVLNVEIRRYGVDEFNRDYIDFNVRFSPVGGGPGVHRYARPV